MPEWSHEANEIFLAAIEIGSAQERAHYVERACEGNVELRQAVEKLLAAAQRADDERFLESQSTPAVETTAARDSNEPDDLIGSQIGNYKILDRIGQGGFGVVYAADQLRPVQRRVAIKIIKPGMDSGRIIARFEAERQALALMDHPNIAKVLDAGTTEAGRLYFVMELVKGVPMTQYCDNEQLTPQQRLELFVPVCQAVQHAHQKGVIHRDLKPSNVLIALYDGRPVPKVIDFGVAKAISQRLTDRTIFTEIGGIVGTLEYMAPEQAELNNLDIDTRADVYSLGVILYELLAGSPPFTAEQLRSAAFDQMLRIIREVEPAKPSTRLSSAAELPAIAARRRIEPARLTRLVHGELDWIVMKALEKDRVRRYATANGLAMDLQRYLADEPVSAGPPSRVYRVRKFVRRNRVAVIGAGVIAMLLVGGITGTTIGLVGQSRQRQIAEAQRARAVEQEAKTQQQATIVRGVNDFLTGMLSSADPQRLLGDKVTVLQAIDAAVKELDAGRFKDHPEVEAAVRQAIGQTLRSLGRYDQAEPNLRRAVQLRRTSAPVPDRALSDSLTALGNLLSDQQKYAEAEAVFGDALTIERATSPDQAVDDVDVAKTMQNLAWVMSSQNKHEQAIAMLRDALAIHRRAQPADDRTLSIAVTHLGLALWRRRALAEAEPLLREALDLNRRTLPAGHPDLAMSLSNLAVVLQSLDRHAEAEALLRESLDISRRALPEGHPDLSTPMNNLAFSLMQQSKLAEAEQLYRQSLAIRRASAAAGGAEPSRNASIATSLTNLADVLRLQKKMDQAQPMMIESLEIFRNALPPDHPTIGTALTNLAWSYMDQNQPAAAEPLFREAMDIKLKALPSNHPEVAPLLASYALALQRQSKFVEAEPVLLQTEKITRTTPRHQRSIELLVALYSAWNKEAPGKGYDQQARQWQATLPATQPATTNSP